MDTPTVTIPHSPSSPSTGSNHSGHPSPIMTPPPGTHLTPPPAPILMTSTPNPPTKEVPVETYKEDPEELVKRYMDSVSTSILHHPYM